MTNPPQVRTSARLLGQLVMKYVRPHWRKMAMAVVFIIIAALATAGFAKLLQPVLDTALIGVQDDPSSINRVYPLALAILGCFIINGLATYAHVILLNRVSQTVVADIQREVFAHFITLDLGFFARQPSADLVSRVTNDVNMMRMAMVDSLTNMGKNILTVILLVAVMMYQDVVLSLITLTVFPLTVFFIAKVGRRIRKLSKTIQAETAILMSVLTQIFQGIRQVQAYGMEGAERARAGAAVDTVRELNTKAVRVGNLTTPLNETLVGLVIAAIIIYGGHKIADGVLTPGGLASFIAAFALAYEPMKRLAKLNNSLQMGLGAADRVMTMFALRPTIFDRPQAQTLQASKITVAFEGVSFAYTDAEGRDIPALNEVSFVLRPGTVTALVGASGSGKTTLLNLLPRFYEPDSGRITINGVDSRELSLASLRAHMALVSQDVTIFDDTVWANIGYGKANAAQEDIIAAAKAAAADDFIRALPQGYNTRLGENGVRLSGGQRQRLAIARAMIRNAPLLLLDEATSALDTTSERAIQKSLALLEKGRTTLVIAHRLSTVQNADDILVLDQGRIVERGTHVALMQEDGLYRKMYSTTLIDDAGEAA